jgi:hypothetical protein
MGYDTTGALKKTHIECRALMAKLNNIVTTEESMHFTLSDGVSRELEVYPGTDLQMKISIKDRVFPLTLTFFYQDEKAKNLTVHYSTDVKLPNEHES